MNRRSLACGLIGVGSALAAAPVAAQDVKYIAHEIHIREGGSWGDRILVQLDSDEAKAIIGTACGALGCVAALPAIYDGIKSMQPKSGTNFHITGDIHRQQGEEWTIALSAPAGFVTCDVAVVPRPQPVPKGESVWMLGKSSEATGSAMIFDQWVGMTVVVPKNRNTGQWFDAALVVKYVKKDSPEFAGCRKRNTVVFAAGPPPSPYGPHLVPTYRDPIPGTF